MTIRAHDLKRENVDHTLMGTVGFTIYVKSREHEREKAANWFASGPSSVLLALCRLESIGYLFRFSVHTSFISSNGRSNRAKSRVRVHKALEKEPLSFG